VSGLPEMRVLIVDDEPFVRSTIKAILRVIGRFIVAEAEDGEAALALLERDPNRHDLVLCDINMQPVSGLQFVEALRRHTKHELRGTAVIMVTAHADEPNVQKAAGLKIAGYLVKPISPKQLRDRLQATFPDWRPGTRPGTERP
jgi:two-component system, chemotaxis family, chemotaxis protein CheY